ncbi:MAG: hypothetical protein ABI972_09810 [Acidobacteriota bacterium]
MLTDATFDVYWRFGTDDDDASYDPFGYYLNGSYFQLTDDNFGAQSGFQSVGLVAGDVFGFYSNATDNCCGASHTQISGYPIGDVPEPSRVFLVAGGLGALRIPPPPRTLTAARSVTSISRRLFPCVRL